MILTDIDDSNKTGVIVLRPNNSWSWRANVLFLSVLMGVSISIATGFLIAGAWLVMPFTLLELTVVTLCLHYCVRQCARQEVIIVSDHKVLIESGIRRPTNRQIFHRMWAKFFVQKPKHPWDPLTLSIRSHGKELEIGSFLNRRDKQDLINELKRVVPA
jgi:uncharacterized membrane protein